MQNMPKKCKRHAKSAFAHLVYIDAVRTINLCLDVEHGLHVICKGLRPWALLLAAEQQHMVRCSAAISGRNHVQERYEVLAHARRQLLSQAEVQQDELQLRPDLLQRLMLSTDLVCLQQRQIGVCSTAMSGMCSAPRNVMNAEDQPT